MPTATVPYTADFLVESLKKRQECLYPRRGLSATRFLIGGIVGSLAVLKFWQGDPATGMAFILVAILLFISQPIYSWSVRRQFEKSPYKNEILKMEFREDGFRVRSPKQDVMLDWSVFTKAAHFRDGVLLFQGPGWVNWIPVRLLDDPSEIVNLEKLLHRKIAVHTVENPDGIKDVSGISDFSQ